MRACGRVALVLMAVCASFGLAGCAAIDELKFAISQWFESAKLTGEREVFFGDLPEAPPIPPLEIPKHDATKPPERIAKQGRKSQRSQIAKLQKQPPPVSDSPEAVRPAETEGLSAPPATLRLRTPYPEAPPPGIFSR